MSWSTALDLARHLAGWGRQAEVVENEGARAEPARIGKELAELLGGG